MTTPVLKKVGLHKGTPDKTTNILIIGDGFSSSDDKLFEKIIFNISKRFFQISPFHLFKDTIAFYSAYIESPASGVSVDIEVNENGEPIIPGKPNKKPSVGKPAEKNSALGFVYKISGGRTVLETTKGHDFIFNLVGTLVDPDKTPNSPIPGCWLKNGKDFGLVCVLVNDDPSEGIAPADAGYIVLSLFRYFCFRLEKDASGKILTDAANRVLHSPDPNADFDAGKLATTLAHEIGHSRFNLADEYTDTDYYKNSQATNDRIEKSENLLAKKKFLDSSGNRTTTDVKWIEKKIYPPHPVTGESSVNNMVLPPVYDYMFPGTQGFKPLKKTTDIPKSGSVEEVPDKQFWDFNKHKYKKPRYEGRILGLYEGAVYDYRDVYRPAGNCIMRTSSSATDHITAAHLDPLPALSQPLSSVTSDISYDSVNSLLIYRGIFLRMDVNPLKALSDDPDYQKAIDDLYNKAEAQQYWPDFFFHSEFCYVCKYAIVEKMEQDPGRRWELLKKLSKEFTFLPYL